MGLKESRQVKDEQFLFDAVFTPGTQAPADALSGQTLETLVLRHTHLELQSNLGGLRIVGERPNHKYRPPFEFPTLVWVDPFSTRS